MSVKAKYIKDLPLKNELDGSESLLVQDSNGTKQAPLGTIVDEIKQNSQEKIRNVQQQVNNLVLGAVGDGNNAEVLQARGDYSVLNDRLDNDFLKKWDEILVKWQDGKFIHGDTGLPVDLDGYSISSLIDVKNRSKIKIKNIKGNNVISAITFYSSDKWQLVKTNIIPNDTNSIEIDVPSNATSFIVSKHTSNASFSVFSFEEQTSLMENISDVINWNEGFYIHNNGGFAPNEEYMYSDVIKVSPNIEIKKIYKISEFPNIAFYDKDYNFIKSINNIDRYVITDDVMDSNVYYFRVATSIAHGTPIINISLKNLYSSNDDFDDRLDNDFLKKWDEILVEWQDGKFIHGDTGLPTDLDDYSISSLIDVKNRSKIKIKNIKGNNVISAITFYSSDKWQLVKTNIIPNDTNSIEIDVPSNATSFIVSKHTSNASFSVFSFEEQTSLIENISDVINWNEGFYIDNNGGFRPNELYMYSDVIKVSPNIEIKKIYKIKEFPNIAFYDKDYKFIKSINNIDRYVIADDTMDSNVYYFRVATSIPHGTPIINVSLKNLYSSNDDFDASSNIDYVSGYIDTNGDVRSPFNGFQVSSLLRCVPGMKVYDIVNNTMFPNVAFYNKNMEFISGINDISELYLTNSIIPENAYYFRVATKTTKPLIIKIPKNYFYNDLGVFKDDGMVNTFINVPEFIDVVVGNETTIYVDHLLLSNNATFSTQLSHKLVDNGIQFTPVTVGNKKIIIQERDNNFSLLLEKSTNIRVIDKNGDGSVKNVLLIGDSLIDNNYVAKEFYRMLDGDGDYVINQLGTRGPSGGKHEGHGGWSWEDYFKESYDGKPNAFYHNGNLDFKNYCSTNGYTGIDYCIIALGTNDVRQGNTSSELFTDAYINLIIEHAKNFIDILTKDYPSCKIAIGLPSIGGDGLITSNPNAFHYKMKKLNNAYITTFDNGIYHPNVTTVAHGLFINTRLGYSYEELPVSKRFASEKVKVYSENIHSNPAGYYCYADGFYGKIRSWLSGNL